MIHTHHPTATHRFSAACLLLSLWLLILPVFAQNFSGTYRGDNVTLVLKTVSGQTSRYSGTVSLGAQKFPAKGQLKAQKIVGSFQANGQAFPFSLRREGNEMVLDSGNTVYRLRSIAVASQNPLARNPLARVPGGAPSAPQTSANDQSGYMGLATVMDDEGQLRVVAVMENGPAQRAGLRRGDVIRQIGGQTITNRDQALAAMRGPVGGRVPMAVARENETGAMEQLNVTVVRSVAPTKATPLAKTAPIKVTPIKTIPINKKAPRGKTRVAAPALRQLSAPLAVGTRITYSGGNAVVQGAASRLVPSGDGEWQDAQGRRYRQDQLESSGGVGFVCLDIVQSGPSFVAADVRNFLIGFNNATSLTETGVVVGNGASLGNSLLNYWIAPARLARMTRGRSGGHQVSRVRYALGGRTYDGLSISDTSNTSYANEIYDLKSGLLLSSSRSNRGDNQRILGANNQLGDARGATVMSHLRLVATRKRQLPWSNSPAPNWAKVGRRLDFQGSVQNVLANSGLPPMPGTGASLSCIIQRVVGGCVLANTMTRFENGPGLPPQESQTPRCYATTSIGSLWVPPAGLARLRPNQVIDQDPLTRFRLTYAGIQNNAAVFIEQGPTEQFYYAYNPQNGMLTGFGSSKGQPNMGEQRVQFRLANAQ